MYSISYIIFGFYLVTDVINQLYSCKYSFQIRIQRKVIWIVKVVKVGILAQVLGVCSN